MKITKEHLKKIIKEEFSFVLAEKCLDDKPATTGESSEFQLKEYEADGEEVKSFGGTLFSKVEDAIRNMPPDTTGEEL